MINQPWLNFPEMKDFKDFRYASTSIEERSIDDCSHTMVIMCLKTIPSTGCLLISSFIEIEI